MATRLLALLLAVTVLRVEPVAAQSRDIQTGWMSWSSTYKLTDRWTLASDVHLRSTDEWSDLRTTIVRPGANFALRPNLAIGVGYAYVRTNAQGGPDTDEHRLWQQLIGTHRVGATPLTHRVRLEQRDIEQPFGPDLHANRLRYFVRAMLPLRHDATGPLVRGRYLALQNEVFLNLDRKERLNGRTLDQNRTFVGFGQRRGDRLDVEIGYLHQYVSARGTDTRNHALMLALVNRF